MPKAFMLGPLEEDLICCNDDLIKTHCLHYEHAFNISSSTVPTLFRGLHIPLYVVESLEAMHLDLNLMVTLYEIGIY